MAHRGSPPTGADRLDPHSLAANPLHHVLGIVGTRERSLVLGLRVHNMDDQLQANMSGSGTPGETRMAHRMILDPMSSGVDVVTLGDRVSLGTHGPASGIQNRLKIESCFRCVVVLGILR